MSLKFRIVELLTVLRGASARGACVAVLSACSSTQYRSTEHATLATPVPLAEGDTGKAPLAEDPEHQAAEAERARANPRPPGFAVDPEPHAAADHHRLQLRYHQGVLSVQGVRQVHYTRPTASARTLGRFAVELWIGRELLERVRFDFPLLGGPPPDPVRNGDRARPTFDSGVDVTREVQFANNPRATRAIVVDRATGYTWELHWPPDSAEAYTPLRLGDATAQTENTTATAVTATATASIPAASSTPAPSVGSAALQSPTSAPSSAE